MKFSNNKYSTINFNDPINSSDFGQNIQQTDYRAINPYYQTISENNPYKAFNSNQNVLVDSYNMPAGVPMIPLYGYDNNEQLDKDCDYMKTLYPKNSKIILKHVEEACDKLEYEGSCMFDDYPDKVYLGIIINQIYDKVMQSNDIEDDVAAQDYYNNYYCKDGRCFIPYYNPSYYPDGSPNWLRDLTETLFYNEMQHRRRRYRGRQRWF